MSSIEARGDLTAQAAIRNAALWLFAEHGPDAVSIRQIAAKAGVSPALVVHHFGNKAGLRAAVDAFAAQAFDQVITDVGEDDIAAVLAEPDGGSVARAFSRVFPPESPLPAYLRRLLLAGDPAGSELFRKWFTATRTLLDGMAARGLAAPSADPDVRAAFLVANDLALILLREPLRATLGVDPLDPAGLARWAKEVSILYRDGAWTGGPEHPTSNEGSE